MLIKNKKDLECLVADLSSFLQGKKEELSRVNKIITSDTDYWITYDYKTVLAYLSGYIKNQYTSKSANRIKPKGKILIILSYNEPFILSIIPILNALIVGNEVTLKPSREAEDFVRMIWLESGFVEKYSLNLKIVSTKSHSETEELIKGVRAVYFFGSHKTAKLIDKICGDNYVEFYPEIETSDCKIFNGNSKAIKRDVKLTLRESFTHSGQTCQRIHGIFVQKNIFNDYLKTLRQEFTKLCSSRELNKFISSEYESNRKGMIESFLADINKAEADEIVKIKELPVLVINPKQNSDYVCNAYFLPVLWISVFESREELVQILNFRKFFLGLNIQSEDGDFSDYIINNTKFTRYTINTSHANIRPKEGWGGSWPSGFSGYKSWLEHFSDGYTVLGKL